MKCKWYYTEFERVCTNDECPYRGAWCPMIEHPEVCKYGEEAPQLSVEELVKTLRICSTEGCPACTLYEFSGCGSILKRQVADMLEKLAEEKDAKKPEPPKEKEQ